MRASSSLSPALSFLIFSLLAVQVACSPPGSSLNKGQPENHPNIIYMYADDLGYGELGSYGQEKINTPNLDRMAVEGMRSEESRVGKACVSRCRSWWLAYH